MTFKACHGLIAVLIVLASEMASPSQARSESSTKTSFCVIKTDLHRGLDWTSFDENPVEIRMSTNLPDGSPDERIVTIAPAFVHGIDTYTIAGPYAGSSEQYAKMPDRPGFDRGPGTEREKNGVRSLKISMAYPSGKPMLIRQRELKINADKEDCINLHRINRTEQTLIEIRLINDAFFRKTDKNPNYEPGKKYSPKTYFEGFNPIYYKGLILNDRFLYYSKDQYYNLVSRNDYDPIQAIGCNTDYGENNKKYVPYCTLIMDIGSKWRISARYADIRILGYESFLQRAEWIKIQTCVQFKICEE